MWKEQRSLITFCSQWESYPCDIHVSPDPGIHTRWEVCGRTHGSWQTATWKVSWFVYCLLVHLLLGAYNHKQKKSYILLSQDQRSVEFSLYNSLVHFCIGCSHVWRRNGVQKISENFLLILFDFSLVNSLHKIVIGSFHILTYCWVIWCGDVQAAGASCSTTSRGDSAGIDKAFFIL